MRKIIISFCILFAALSLQAQSVNGIRIDGGNTPILVYLGGNQICLPTTTCFVANLKSGYYTVEVYATRFTRPRWTSMERGKIVQWTCLFQRKRCNGNNGEWTWWDASGQQTRTSGTRWTSPGLWSVWQGNEQTAFQAFLIMSRMSLSRKIALR